MKTAFLKTCSRLGLSRIARGLTGHGVRILAYHGFCDGDEARFQPMLFMRAQTFRARMQRLLESGHRVISLAEAVRRLEARDIEPGLAVKLRSTTAGTAYTSTPGPCCASWICPRPFTCSYYRTCQLPVLNVFARYLVWRSPLPVALDGSRPVSQGGRRLRIAPPGTCLPTACPGMRMRCSRRRSVLPSCAPSPRGSRSTSSPCSRGEPFTSCRPLSSASSPRVCGWSCIRTVTGFRQRTARACGEEIERNRRFLADITGTTSTHFCYPSGEYRLHQKAWLRELGVTSATTTRHGLSYAGMDAMELPRFLDSDAHPPELFDAALAGLLAILREPAATLRRSLAD